MRNFQRIGREQSIIDGLTQEEYESVVLPVRSTINSAGYDFRTLRDLVIPAGTSIKVPTGVRAYMLDDEVLQLFIRSSLGFKNNIRLSNCTGIVDSDYYYAANQGHIWVGLYNDGDEDFLIKAGDRIVQGIFVKFLTVGDIVDVPRVGGFGSTD